MIISVFRYFYEPLYFSKLDLKKKVQFYIHSNIYNVYISFTESMTEVYTELHRS